MNATSFDFSPLPIFVGITGHRDIPLKAVSELEGRITSQLLRLQKQYPHCPVIVFSPLAEGADRIGARAALNTGCSLHVPLPMEREEYEKDFDEISRKEFSELLSRSDAVFVVAASEDPPDSPPRGYFYRQIGLYIAKHAHVLIALWDGTERLYPEGGGTFETVSFMRGEKGIICHIPTPRLSSPNTTLPDMVPDIPKDKRLITIEEYNRALKKEREELTEAATINKPYVVDAETEKLLTPGSTKLLNTFLYADALSVKYRNLKLLTLRLLSVLGLLLVLSFLLYDEMESDLMLVVYGAVICAAAVIYFISIRRAFHEKYIIYRALAEALRVQLYWGMSNFSEDVYEHYTYTQKSELDFVRYVLRSLKAGPSANERNDNEVKISPDRIFQLWINGQYDYHSVSAFKKGKQERRNTSTAKLMFILSILLFILVVIVELFFKASAEKAVPFSDTIRKFLLMHEGQMVIWRGIIKIILGVISGATAFLANYYGSLSLPQQIFNSTRMRSLFKSA
ncbi:MAG: hypothetical protein GX900_02860, partial [Clostridiaceae bacterium]|nr:hypothetical protein [Clostridiaceae bacterium]